MKKTFLILLIAVAFAFTVNAQTTKIPTTIKTTQVQQPGGGGTEQCYCNYKGPDGTYCGKVATDCFLFKCVLHHFIIAEAVNKDDCESEDNCATQPQKTDVTPATKEQSINLE